MPASSAFAVPAGSAFAMTASSAFAMLDLDLDLDLAENSENSKWVSNESSGHEDSFCPKIVKIGAIGCF